MRGFFLVPVRYNIKSMQIELDYPVRSTPRWGHGRPLHPVLSRLIERHKDRYRANLRGMAAQADRLAKIPLEESEEAPLSPHWLNPWFSGLDAIALYGLLAQEHPDTYWEIGSGASTKFARRAIQDFGLRTRIVSIDPSPRAEVDALCDEVIRQPIEEVEADVVNRIGAHDFLFVDNSHRILMNSDCVAVFFDVLPQLPTGAMVHFHDIFLPADYPPVWADRYYSEQYVLAALLLADGRNLSIEFPSYFVSEDRELARILDPIWEGPLASVQKHGGSFWLRVEEAWLP